MLLLHRESGLIAHANPSATKLYGLSREEFTRKFLFDLEAGSFSAVSGRLLEAVSRLRHVFRSSHKLAKGCVQEVDCQCIPVRMKDREYLLLTVHPVADHNGGGPGGYDIEEELRKAENMRRNLQEQIG